MTPLQPLDVALTGVQLIEASAGSGKTFAITTLVLRAIVEQGLEPSRILVVTFTNAATAELRGRLRERLQRAWLALAAPDAAAGDPDLAAYVRRRSDLGQAAADRQRLRAALDGFDEAAVFTIHGFCQRVLRELAFESGAAFDVDLLGDPRPLVLEAVQDFWSRRLYDAPDAVVAALPAHGVTPDALAAIAAAFLQHRELQVEPPPAAPAEDGEAVRFARALVREVGPAVLGALTARKAAFNAQDFDDLLHQVDAALGGPQGDHLAAALRARYPLALIDEFQDTDPVQYRIFQRLYAGAAGAALFVIGDPKQAIYAFRGADVFAYLNAQHGADAAHTLPTNWRSAPLLVDAVNTLFGVAADAFVLDDLRFRAAQAAPRNADRQAGAAAGPPLRILFAPRPAPRARPHNRTVDAAHWLPRAVADQIVARLDGSLLLDGRPAEPGDVAVLCRTNNQLHLMHAALRAAGLPSVVLGDASVFAAPEALHLERVLRALAEPTDANAVRVALATPLLGVDGAGLAALADDEARWERWVEGFQFWAERWRSAGFTAAVRGLLDEQGVAPRLLAQAGGERSLTNLFHLCELAQQAASDGRRGPHNMVEWLARLRTDEALRRELGSEAAQVRLESDARAVQLNTVHRSKGLEYPIVVLPFAWYGVTGPHDLEFPRFHAGAPRRLHIDLGLPPADTSVAQASRELAAEDVRLLYVATTRAQQLCLVVWGAFNKFGASALAHVLHRHPRRDTAVPARTPAEIGALGDDALRADLSALAAASAGGIGVEDLPPPRDLRHVAGRGRDEPLCAPPPVAPVLPAWRIGSFTGLTAAGEGFGLRAEEGIDRDEQADDGSPSTGSGAGLLAGFPRGRGPGTLVHRILELADFTAADPAALRALVGRQLGVFGIGREWTEPLAAALRNVLATPLLAGAPLRLCDVPRSRRRDEMEFAYPVAAAGAALSAAGLARVFARAGETAALRAYAEHLRHLRFTALRGFLRGYIDCVFAHDGRWYVVDYKTNDLGSAPGAYAPPALAAEMVRHHYLLQAHLYVIAVHRYLSRRLPDYAYERHFGGALYLFVRGMTPARGAASGVFHLRPAPALVAALDRELAGGGGGAA